VKLSRRAAVAVSLAVVVAAAVFFLAPVSFWFNEGPPFYTAHPVYTPVYRSLGCAALGVGDLYAPGWFGFSLGCGIPVPVPL
jgi:hypothetical protein